MTVNRGSTTSLGVTGNEAPGVPGRGLPPDGWEYESCICKVPGGYEVFHLQRSVGIFDCFTRARGYIAVRWPEDNVWVDMEGAS